MASISLDADWPFACIQAELARCIHPSHCSEFCALLTSSTDAPPLQPTQKNMDSAQKRSMSCAESSTTHYARGAAGTQNGRQNGSQRQAVAHSNAAPHSGGIASSIGALPFPLGEGWQVRCEKKHCYNFVWDSEGAAAPSPLCKQHQPQAHHQLAHLTHSDDNPAPAGAGTVDDKPSPELRELWNLSNKSWASSMASRTLPAPADIRGTHALALATAVANILLLEQSHAPKPLKDAYRSASQGSTKWDARIHTGRLAFAALFKSAPVASVDKPTRRLVLDAVVAMARRFDADASDWRGATAAWEGLCDAVPAALRAPLTAAHDNPQHRALLYVDGSITIPETLVEFVIQIMTKKTLPIFGHANWSKWLNRKGDKCTPSDKEALMRYAMITDNDASSTDTGPGAVNYADQPWGREYMQFPSSPSASDSGDERTYANVLTSPPSPSTGPHSDSSGGRRGDGCVLDSTAPPLAPLTLPPPQHPDRSHTPDPPCTTAAEHTDSMEPDGSDKENNGCKTIDAPTTKAGAERATDLENKGGEAPTDEGDQPESPEDLAPATATPAPAPASAPTTPPPARVKKERAAGTGMADGGPDAGDPPPTYNTVWDDDWAAMEEAAKRNAEAVTALEQRQQQQQQ